MISSFVGTVVQDVMRARTGKTLDKAYLPAVAEYVQSATDEVLAKDLMPLTTMLAQGTSVIAVAPVLMREKNMLFKAILVSLSEDLSKIPAATSLGQYLASIEDAGVQYTQILTREMQSLLLAATGVDSPIVQVATELPASAVKDAKLSGVPFVSVNKSLIGGVRIFHNGTLRDDSWKARLTSILTAIK